MEFEVTEAASNPRWVSLAEVAAEAGVSARTVARVMNDRAKVAAATAERVEEIAARLGYKGNELARSLKASRSRTLGLVVPDISNPFFAACCKAIEETARQRGYTIMLCDSDADGQRQTEYVDLLVRRRVDGLIIAAVPGDKDALLPDRVNHLPVIAFDRPAAGSRTDVVVTNSKGIYDATRHLIEHGHQRVAFVGQMRQMYTTRKRLSGFRRAMKEAGLADDLVRLDAQNVYDAAQHVQQLLSAPSPPTAVVAGNSLITAGALHFADVEGIRVPENLALIGYDDFELLEFLSPRLTRVRQPTYGMGKAATEAILDLLDEAAVGRRKIVLPTTLATATSCGCESRPTPAQPNDSPGEDTR